MRLSCHARHGRPYRSLAECTLPIEDGDRSGDMRPCSRDATSIKNGSSRLLAHHSLLKWISLQPHQIDDVQIRASVLIASGGPLMGTWRCQSDITMLGRGSPIRGGPVTSRRRLRRLGPRGRLRLPSLQNEVLSCRARDDVECQRVGRARVLDGWICVVTVLGRQ